VTFEGRNFEALSQLGFGRFVLDRLSEDWSEGFGASSFVLLVEHRVKKGPQNVISSDSTPWLKAQRAIGALRLLASGDLACGPMWIIRSSAFRIGVEVARAGLSIPNFGSAYVLADDTVAAFPKLYSELRKLEQVGYGRAPGNLDLALRSFMATYDRWPSGNDSRLVDSITALEAVLGTEAEISFKLAFRVASLLAATDHQRAALLEDVRSFYDTRSKLVHGKSLKKKHLANLERVDELRATVRCLLRAFVGFAATGPSNYTKEFFEAHLDAALVDASQRAALRTAIGL